jgi:hypothetical protein
MNQHTASGFLKRIAISKNFTVEEFVDEFDEMSRTASINYDKIQNSLLEGPRRVMLERVKEMIKSKLSSVNDTIGFKKLTLNETKWFNKSKDVSLDDLMGFYDNMIAPQRRRANQEKAFRIIQEERHQKQSYLKRMQNEEQTRINQAKSVANALERSRLKKNAIENAKRQAEAEAIARYQAEALRAKAEAEAKKRNTDEHKELNERMTTAFKKGRNYKSKYGTRRNLLNTLNLEGLNFIPSLDHEQSTPTSRRRIRFENEPTISGGRSTRSKRKRHVRKTRK